ncbi:hypothetical protein Ga0466249_005437 [Sporomusaceae bacterium BoRhaA]|nr:hypothetical protein [Pelorhabdus rhamnosifermentans]
MLRLMACRGCWDRWILRARMRGRGRGRGEECQNYMIVV